MKRSFVVVAALLLIPALFAGAKEPPSVHVDPFIGTGGHGHTFPGATRPFGMVQLSPDTRLTGWDGCSGYHNSDGRIFGFSHTHLSGTGVADYADILFMPRLGDVRITNGEGKGETKSYASPFRKTLERASPGYYSVLLDDTGINVELTATKRVGVHRYTFPRSADAYVLIDLKHRDEVLESRIRITSDREIEGMRRSSSWSDDQVIYFVARFSKPFTKHTIALDDTLNNELKEVSGKNVKAVLGFATTWGEQVLVKVGISAVDIDGARKNLEAEVPGFDFEAVRDAAEAEWDSELGRIEVEGGTPDQQKIFYTGLYHAFIQPNLFVDVDGRYRGMDRKIHQAEGFNMYTVFSLWDTFRAAHPLYTLVQQKRTVDFLQTFLAQYRQGGNLPVWELGGFETDCMIGYHAVPVIADALLKGIGGVDEKALYDAMKAAAERRQYRGLDPYRELGFVPAEQDSESVSKTLEYAYDDWCIARVAEKLGNREDAARYNRRAQGYKHLFDPSVGFMRARLNGLWFTPFVPNEINFNYTEANAWQYTFFVPQDIDGLIALLGGKDAFAKKLDGLFSADSKLAGADQPDVTGLVGQYAHGNEPSHHIAYLYPFAGRPWETQKLVRQLLTTMYAAAPDGLIGNEDCGQMSSWFILSAMGFYPVTPGSNEYVIGSPLFEKVTLKLENGKTFVIRANNVTQNNVYVQSAALNGTPWRKAYLQHADIIAGGEMIFEMGATPNREWGVGPGNEIETAIKENPILAVPFVAKGERSFKGSTEVALGSVDRGVIIRYTDDGSDPNEESYLYKKPFSIAKNTSLKWRSEKPGYLTTPVATAKFYATPKRMLIHLGTDYTPRYSGGGDYALIDGIRGGPDFRIGGWQGYFGVDIDAVIDLGREKKITKLTMGFLQDQRSWIFMPSRVEFYASTDGKSYKKIGEVKSDVPEKTDGVVIKDLVLQAPPFTARFVHVIAKNHGANPPWHPSAGEKTHLFADEIVIE